MTLPPIKTDGRQENPKLNLYLQGNLSLSQLTNKRKKKRERNKRGENPKNAYKYRLIKETEEELSEIVICCCFSVAKLCPTLCNLLDRSIPGCSALHCLLVSVQILVYWSYLIISSSIAPFSVCFQSFPALESFPVSWLFLSGGQSIGVSVQQQSFQWIFRTDFL